MKRSLTLMNQAFFRKLGFPQKSPTIEAKISKPLKIDKSTSKEIQKCMSHELDLWFLYSHTAFHLDKYQLHGFSNLSSQLGTHHNNNSTKWSHFLHQVRTNNTHSQKL